MKLNSVCKILLMQLLISGCSSAISVTCSDEDSSISIDYDLDRSARLESRFILGDGVISSSQSLDGSGSNSITQIAGNRGASVSSSINSIGTLKASTSSYASGRFVGLGQNIQATGQSESEVISSSRSNRASQEAGVFDGTIFSSQEALVHASEASAIQRSDMSGAIGYSNGGAKSMNDIVDVTGGINGIGSLSSTITTKASESAMASGSIQTGSLSSTGYSAVKSTSSDGDAYSYLSSNDRLVSSMNAGANGHVSALQALLANGDTEVYLSSTSDDASSKNYAANGNDISGTISASAGSPATMDISLNGDINSASSNLVPVPGSWIWDGYGGYLDSDPFIICDAQGRNHVFVKGGDSGLYDNIDGNWYALGGVITSDPYAIQDQQGRMHIFARGGDLALWDNVFDTGSWTANWYGLGGGITLDPSAAMEPFPGGWIIVAARGNDGALWVKDINPEDMSGHPWQTLGGYTKSSPYIIFDYQGNMQTTVRGGDDALWVNTGTTTPNGYEIEWNSYGGVITSAAKPLVDPVWNALGVFARGSDGKLWTNTIDSQSGVGNWYGLGAEISPGGSGSSIYEGNPEPIVDDDGNIHVFFRGKDGSLMDAVGFYDPYSNSRGYYLYGLGGYITSDPSAMAGSDRIKIAARGGDGALWVNSIEKDYLPSI